MSTDLRPTVLLVEDSPFWSQLVADALAELPAAYAVHLLNVEDGTGALAALGGEHVLVAVILDICLPGPMSGLDILDAIRHADKPWIAHLPVAMFTTSPSGLDIARAKVLGVDRYIAKTAELNGIAQLQMLLRGFVVAIIEREHHA